MGSLGALHSFSVTAAQDALSPKPVPTEPLGRLEATAWWSDHSNMLLLGDAASHLQEMGKLGVKVDAIVTSPPYYGKRDYGEIGQLGLEAHPSEFVSRLLDVFNLCRPLLRDGGSLWVNLGDTYWSGKGASRGVDGKQSARRGFIRPQDARGDGAWARPKQLLLIPHRFAIAMQDDGWLVRNDNVWAKPNPVPDPVRDRCSSAHEFVFHFTNSRWYYYDPEVLPRLDVWDSPTSAGQGSHRASYSVDLIDFPLRASVPPGGVVLDPFVGSGTTLVAARLQGLRGIGIDLSESYLVQAAARLESQATGHE